MPSVNNNGSHIDVVYPMREAVHTITRAEHYMILNAEVSGLSTRPPG